MAQGSMTKDDVVSTELAAGEGARGSTLVFGSAAPGPMALRLRLVAAYDLQQAMCDLLHALANRGPLLQPTLRLACTIGQAIALECSPGVLHVAHATLDRAVGKLQERDADDASPRERPSWFQEF